MQLFNFNRLCFRLRFGQNLQQLNLKNQNRVRGNICSLTPLTVSQIGRDEQLPFGALGPSLRLLLPGRSTEGGIITQSYRRVKRRLIKLSALGWYWLREYREYSLMLVHLPPIQCQAPGASRWWEYPFAYPNPSCCTSCG